MRVNGASNKATPPLVISNRRTTAANMREVMGNKDTSSKVMPLHSKQRMQHHSKRRMSPLKRQPMSLLKRLCHTQHHSKRQVMGRANKATRPILKRVMGAGWMLLLRMPLHKRRHTPCPRLFLPAPPRSLALNQWHLLHKHRFTTPHPRHRLHRPFWHSQQ